MPVIRSHAVFLSGTPEDAIRCPAAGPGQRALPVGCRTKQVVM
jgi:hypothetical protein